MFESKDGTTILKYLIRLKDTTFFKTICLSSPELQTYKVEERTFGTPGIDFRLVLTLSTSLDDPEAQLKNVCLVTGRFFPRILKILS